MQTPSIVSQKRENLFKNTHRIINIKVSFKYILIYISCKEFKVFRLYDHPVKPKVHENVKMFSFRRNGTGIGRKRSVLRETTILPLRFVSKTATHFAYRNASGSY
jgi:hypothetical protein